MVKTQLQLFLTKVSQGDMSFMPKLCAQLADRLIYAPVLRKRDPSRGATTKVSAIRIREGERSIIPVFTALPVLKKWCELNELENESISLLCADLCGALEKGSWLLIDGGTTHQVELAPDSVQMIAQYQSEELEEETLAPQTQPRWTPPADVPKADLNPPRNFGAPVRDLTASQGEAGVAKEVAFKGYLLGEEGTRGRIIQNNLTTVAPSSVAPSRVRAREDDDEEYSGTRDLTGLLKGKPE